MNIKVAWLLYKLTNVVEYLQCNELFAITFQFMMHLVLCEFVLVVNEVLKNQI
jgi:hypothetical protein